MANTFHAQIMTPVGTLFDGEVLGVRVPGVEGSFEIMYNHAPIISLLDAGEIRVRETGSDTAFRVSGGFVEMSNNRLTLMAEEAEAVTETDLS